MSIPRRTDAGAPHGRTTASLRFAGHPLYGALAMAQTQRNRLADSTSPYLQQHATNPVDWYPWGQEALDKARAERKPILLSIGYSACHWCHVMARESFEDEATARLMNELFVNVKVDREERPDLDRIYQLAHQLLTQRAGGWPLTVFLSPEGQVPVFAGTYFPREARQGMPAFKDVLERVARYLREHPDEVERHNTAMADILTQLSRAPAPGPLDAQALQAARQHLQDAFDPQHGGFGSAPKFPHPTSIERLLRHYASSTGHARQPDRQALHMACLTLRRMALGGIYDQVGGGFARYAVDDYWMIPHFEKMLYDNGQLLGLYADAWHATGDELFARVARETAGWIMLEMQAPEGGYYSSLAADSEGQEGRYYVWQRDELKGLLNEEDYALVERRFGLDEPPNFEGHWHLHVHASFSELAHALGQPRPQILRRWESIRERLYAVRTRRVRPERDEKVLASWNALAIKGMARAGRVLNAPELLASGRRALEFVRSRMWSHGRLLASYRNGQAAFAGYLDDYAFLLDALLEMLQSDWRDEDLDFARTLADAMLAHFQDSDSGGFFFTADDHEPLIQRPRPLQDEATPAGNGVAAYALARLGHLIGEMRYLRAAERTLQAAARAMREVPLAHGSLLTALEEYLYPPQRVVIRAENAQAPAWRAAAEQYYVPQRQVYIIPSTARVPSALAALPAQGGGCAYICSADRCLPPASSPTELAAHLW